MVGYIEDLELISVADILKDVSLNNITMVSFTNFSFAPERVNDKALNILVTDLVIFLSISLTIFVSFYCRICCLQSSINNEANLAPSGSKYKLTLNSQLSELQT